MRTGKTLPLRINHSAEHPGDPLTYLPLHLWKDPKSSFASFWVGRWVGLLLGKWSLSSPPWFSPWTELFRVPECGSCSCWGSLLAHGPRAVATGDCIHSVAPSRLLWDCAPLNGLLQKDPFHPFPFHPHRRAYRLGAMLFCPQSPYKLMTRNSSFMFIY